MDLASSSHATIVPHVKRISLILHEGDEVSDSRIVRGCKIPYTTILLLGVKTFSSLRSIIILGDRRTKVDGEVIAEVLASLLHLKSLVLDDLTLDNFEVLCDIVGSCTGLESLYLTGINEISEPAVISQGAPPPCPPLKIFGAMNCAFTARLLAWIGESQARRPETVFMGGNDVYRHQGRFAKFLRNLGPALKELWIEQNPVEGSLTAQTSQPQSEPPPHLDHVF